MWFCLSTLRQVWPPFHLKALKLTAAVYWSLPMVQVWFFSSPMTVVLFTGSAAHSAVCVCVCSEQSDPGSDRSSGGDQLYRLPPPPGRALQRGRIDPAAVGPSAQAVQHNQRRSQRRPGLIILHLCHATLQIRCPGHRAPPPRPPGHLQTQN